MCVDKNEWKEFKEEVMEVVKEVKHDTGNIRQTQTALGNAVGDVETHLRKLNSRTSKIESRTDNLEDPEFREVRCIQRESIDHIMHNMLTVEKFEEMERKKHEEKERQEARKMKGELIAIQALDARQRRLQWIVSAIVGAGTIVVALITYVS